MRLRGCGRGWWRVRSRGRDRLRGAVRPAAGGLEGQPLASRRCRGSAGSCSAAGQGSDGSVIVPLFNVSFARTWVYQAGTSHRFRCQGPGWPEMIFPWGRPNLSLAWKAESCCGWTTSARARDDEGLATCNTFGTDEADGNPLREADGLLLVVRNGEATHGPGLDALGHWGGTATALRQRCCDSLKTAIQ